MKKFEYRLLEVRDGMFSTIDYQGLTEKLNELGQVGWELVSLTITDIVLGLNRGQHAVTVLKREVV